MYSKGKPVILRDVRSADISEVSKILGKYGGTYVLTAPESGRTLAVDIICTLRAPSNKPAFRKDWDKFLTQSYLDR